MEFIQDHPKLTIITGVLVPFLILVQKWFNGGTCQLDTDLKGKVIIVTGGNNGIGRETVRLLAERGATVVLGCRSKEKALEAISQIKQSLKNKNIDAKLEFIKLDLSSLSSVQQFCETFKQSFNRLDVLVNNAGLVNYVYQKTAEGFQNGFGVNHIGTFAVTIQLMDTLAATPNSRIVTVSSMMHIAVNKTPDFQKAVLQQPKYDGNQAYSLGKLANILFTKELQRRIDEKKLNIKAVSLHPGAVRTNIFHEMKLPLQILFTIFYPIVYLTFKNSEDGAQTSLQCAIENFDKLVGGGYYSDCKLQQVSQLAQDSELAQNLFQLSEDWTNLKF